MNVHVMNVRRGVGCVHLSVGYPQTPGDPPCVTHRIGGCTEIKDGRDAMGECLSEFMIVVESPNHALFCSYENPPFSQLGGVERCGKFEKSGRDFQSLPLAEGRLDC